MKPIRNSLRQRLTRFRAAALIACLAQFLATLFLINCEAWAADSERVFRVGITSFRDKSVTIREWEPTMAYLSAQLPGTRFEPVPLNLPEFEIALGRKEIDFVITNPEHYILMETLYGVSRVATLVKSENGRLVNQFGGVVFVRGDRQDLRHLEDVRGKTIASVDRTSFAAFLVQYDLFKQRGIDINKEAKVTFLGFPQDLSVLAVLEGRADVGFVRTGVLESMAKEGKVDLSRFRILNPTKAPDFPFLLSTGLFPEWPLAAAPHVPMEITNRVVAALLLMPPDGAASKSARYYRWSTPVEYLSVQNLMRSHHVYPYDRPENVSLLAILQEYAPYLILCISLVAVAMAILYARAHRLNVELKLSRRQLSDLAHHDALTGLPNRNLLDDHLEKAVAHANRTGSSLAVCLMDLDGFKPINDTWGHKVGDEVLQEVARRLQANLRGSDTVARWGGDEFVLLLNDLAGEQLLAEAMERILAAVSQGFSFCPSRVTGSIGVALYPTGLADGHKLLRQADEAMYQAKKRGGNRYAVYTEPEAGNPPSQSPAGGQEGNIIAFPKQLTVV